MSGLTLAQRVEAIDAALADSPHAFGGALALAYYAEPRSTIDIDVNVFIPAERFAEVAGPLVRLGAAADDPAVAELVRRDGQARVMWDDTPIDLFFSVLPFHDEVERNVRHVSFGDRTIPVLDCTGLAVFKAMFARSRDWVDIEAMVEARSLDVDEAIRWTREMVGEDERVAKLAALRDDRRSQGEPPPLRPAARPPEDESG